MKTDIILLASVFVTLRNTCHGTYGLDPAHYYTVPGLTFYCMLKYTKCKFETNQDVDILLFIEQGIRGGIGQCSNRICTANNKYLEKKKFNPQRVTTLWYFDVNNLYGCGMMQLLAYEALTWVDTNIDVTSIPDDSPVGYILEVDLEYPDTLHELHKDLSFCPEHRTPPNSNYPKLNTSLYDKYNYVIHYRNLKKSSSTRFKIDMYSQSSTIHTI